MMFTYCALQRELLSASVTELLGAKMVRVPDSGVRRAGDDDPLIILQTQHRARVTSQYLQTLQRLLIPDLWWKGGQVGKKEKKNKQTTWSDRCICREGHAQTGTWQNK